jgi:hypothetical protein
MSDSLPCILSVKRSASRDLQSTEFTQENRWIDFSVDVS